MRTTATPAAALSACSSPRGVARLGPPAPGWSAVPRGETCTRPPDTLRQGGDNVGQEFQYLTFHLGSPHRKLSSPKSVGGWLEWSRRNIKKGGRSSANQMSPT